MPAFNSIANSVFSTLFSKIDMEETGYTEPMDIEVRYYYLADELVLSHCELEEIYRHYNRKVEELNQLILAYHGLFGEKHSEYLIASRMRQKEQTRLRHREKEENEWKQVLPGTAGKAAL